MSDRSQPAKPTNNGTSQPSTLAPSVSSAKSSALHKRCPSDHPPADTPDSDGNSDDSDSSYEIPVNGPWAAGSTKGSQRPQQQPTQQQRLHHQKSEGWEIVEGLRDVGQLTCSPERPARLQGFLSKRRKWPMKGWHKRLFILEKGLLSYAKSQNQIKKGRYQGQVDLGLSVVSYKVKRGRIDIDADTIVHHIKLKEADLFIKWMNAIKEHRLYRQYELTVGCSIGGRPPGNGLELAGGTASLVADAAGIVVGTILPLAGTPDQSSPSSGTAAAVITPSDKDETQVSPELVRTLSLQRDVQTNPASTPWPLHRRTSQRQLAWILDSRSSSLERYNQDFVQLQSRLFDMTSCLDKLNAQASASENHSEVLGVGLSQSSSNPNLLALPTSGVLTTENATNRHRKHLRSSSGVPDSNLTASTSSQVLNKTCPQESSTGALSKQFTSMANEIVDQLKAMANNLCSEKDRLRQAALELRGSFGGTASPVPSVQTLGTTYSQSMKLIEVMRQNADLRARLLRIRAETDVGPCSGSATNVAAANLVSQGGGGSFCSPSATLLDIKSPSHGSVSESFHDAYEYLDSDVTSSEGSDEESGESDTEDVSIDESCRIMPVIAAKTGRRERLPAPMPDSSDVSLINLLCKNIGRDLSRIRLPVILNEPLSALQRLCEDLEYSELLDQAALMEDPLERMVYVAAFAVSGYACTFYRSGAKPFNPLIGETYECIREDKSWRFIAEQVSHHPPISICHCESDNWIWWQELRLKNKFWGKSLEAIPMGKIHLNFKKWEVGYSWNKVTSCIHNIFSGQQRYVDHYGEMVVEATDGSQCKLTFYKASSWTGQRFEVSGLVSTSDGRRRQVFGKWNEGIYCGEKGAAKCVWRSATMPEGYELYYGFTRFAIELNDLDPSQTAVFPRTDTRFRPDQRLLEEGRVEEAEQEKTRVEGLQRERIAKVEEPGEEWQPKWFRRVKIEKDFSYEFLGTYWRAKSLGFAALDLPQLW